MAYAYKPGGTFNEAIIILHGLNSDALGILLDRGFKLKK